MILSEQIKHAKENFFRIESELIEPILQTISHKEELVSLQVPKCVTISEVGQCMDKNGRGIIATMKIPKFTFLGVYEGEILRLTEEEVNSSISDKIFWIKGEASISSEGKETEKYIDGDNIHESNWTRFMNCSETAESANVGGEYIPGTYLFGTRKDIFPGEELHFYYNNEFAGQIYSKKQTE